MVEIRQVRGSRDLRRFVGFPLWLYRDNPYYVPQLLSDEINTLSPDRNPAFEHCEARYWLAIRDGRVVGRIAGIVNHKFPLVWGKKWARFGWIDFVDDYEVSAALLGAVEDWARSLGMEAVHGPMGFAVWTERACL